MAILRQQNWLGQQRVDVPHLRAVEDGVVGDFDALAGIAIANKQALVVKGFRFIDSTTTGAATSLQIAVADSVAIHYMATDAGSIFRTEDGLAPETMSALNPNVVGSFAPGQYNFIGLDLVRQELDSSADVVQFLVPDTNSEDPKIVPTAKVLKYRFVISQAEFSATPNLLPLCVVETSASNSIVAVTDARNVLGSLASGGSVPNNNNFYTWSGSRTSGGLDRNLTSFKTWMDAVASRLWEVGGGYYWYSAGTDRNIRMASDDTFTSTGEPWEWVGSNAHWKGIKFIFDNAPGWYNTVANQTVNEPGLTDLADGECLYVDLEKGSNANITARKAPLITLGMSSVPGNRTVMAWRRGANLYVRDQSYYVGGSLKVATPSVNGAVTLSTTAQTPSTPKVGVISNGFFQIGGVGGITRDGLSLGDLRIGGGANDQNVSLVTIGNNSSVIAYSDADYTNGNATLTVKNNFNGTNTRIANFKANGGGGNVEVIRAAVDVTGAIRQSPVWRLPEVTAITSTELSRSSMFMMPSRTWLTNVVLTGPIPTTYTPSGSGIGKTLTANSNGALVLDGVTPTVGQRVLALSIQDSVDSGIWTVTVVGDGGNPFVLTRATDWDESEQIMPGSGVLVTSGTNYTNTYWYCDTPPPYTIEMTQFNWVQVVNKATSDLFCVRWHDGTVTVVASGPTYYP